MSDEDAALRQARVDLAALHRYVCAREWNDSVVNHMTFMVPGHHENYLVIPYGTHWSEVRASDFLIVDADGKVVSGSGEPELSGTALHGPMHRRLKQARCVIHTHQPNVTALTALKDQTLLMVHQDATMFHGVMAYVDTYGALPTDEGEGDAVADVLGDALVLFLANHGPMVVGPTVAQAFQTLYYLDRIARLQMMAFSAGREVQVIAPNIVEKMAPSIRGFYLGREAELHFEAQKRRLDRAGADYAH